VIQESPQRVNPLPRVRVVYIAGAKNCGSTLLDAVLGHAPGALSLGEAGGFQRYEPGRACACGRPSEGCDLCQTVCGAVGEQTSPSEFARIAALPLKERRVHWTLLATRPRADYARVADSVFDAAAAATGSTVLIDSSKNVARAAALVHDSRHDVRVVHLVRDARGYLRSRRERARADGGRYLPPMALAEWVVKNSLLSSVLAARMPADRYLLCRYEDLMRDTRAELRRVGEFAGLDTTGLAEAALGAGLERDHLFEPRRRADYRRVRLDPERLDSQRWSPAKNAGFWVAGGFVSRRWGYDRGQSYLSADRPRALL
jgi:hypothetical protein